MSALKPTSIDFKPRMAIELKPPHVEFKPSTTEFNPAQVGLTSNQPSTSRIQLTAPRAPFSQRDVDDSFQSNRAIAIQISPFQTRGRPDDTVYLDQLHPSVSRDVVSDSSLENHLHAPEDLQQQSFLMTPTGLRTFILTDCLLTSLRMNYMHWLHRSGRSRVSGHLLVM